MHVHCCGSHVKMAELHRLEPERSSASWKQTHAWSTQVVVDYNYRRGIQNLLNMFVQGGNVFQECYLLT